VPSSATTPIAGSGRGCHRSGIRRTSDRTTEGVRWIASSIAVPGAGKATQISPSEPSDRLSG
jgi:hypothetical protein